MKILHVIAGLKLSYPGGVSNYVRMLAETQHKNGDEVWILGEKDSIKYPFNYYEYKTDKICSFTIGKMEDKNGLKQIEKFFKQQSFDIIHLHAVFNLDWDFFKVVKSYCYIVSLHDYFYLCPRGAVMITPRRKLCTYYSEEKCCACIGYLEQMVEKNWLLRKICGFFRRFLHVNLKTKLPYMYQKVTITRFEKMKCLLENAALLLPVSRRTKEIYENSSIVNKYEILYIGNIHADQYTENYVLSPLNIDSKIHIAMVGELSYMKGAEIFIKIAKTIDKNKYVMHFYGKSQKEYEKVAQASGVIMHGKYKQSEMKEILQKVDVGLVLPVCEDAGPQVVMELLNNHIPVVATRIGGIPDFVSDSNGFLFDPYNEKEFTNLVDFFDKLNFEKINTLKKDIKRTTTTQEHYLALSRIYQEILNNQ